MKRTILTIMVILLCGISIHALEPTPIAKKAKTEIFQSLSKYSKSVTDIDSETIMFVYEGSQYRAFVHSLNTKVLYLGITLGFNLPEEYNTEIANLAALNAAGNKPVCSAAYDGVLMFSCEMYTKDAKHFISVLPEMLEALNSSAEAFLEEYDKISETYVPHTTTSIGSIRNDNEYIYPKVESSGDSKLYIKKVTLESNRTVLDMVSYNGRQYQNCAISRNSYISANGQKYVIEKAEGITYLPQYTDYPNYDSGREVALHFKLYFPALPQGVSKFDFSEGSIDGWQIKGVELKHGQLFTLNGENIETAYHTWDCKAMEIQNGQTIITKTVTPKSEGTFMFSSQDEFIEDADTGRKYYLMNSSIGFEGSPEISYDTSTITFYEVYPALPSTVKRINISSGSQYYVSGLKIR